MGAWFKGGKEDPRLCLLRFEPGPAKIWKDASSIVAGIELFIGMGDPKEDYENNMAKVDLK